MTEPTKEAMETALKLCKDWWISTSIAKDIARAFDAFHASQMQADPRYGKVHTDSSRSGGQPPSKSGADAHGNLEGEPAYGSGMNAIDFGFYIEATMKSSVEGTDNEVSRATTQMTKTLGTEFVHKPKWQPKSGAGEVVGVPADSAPSASGTEELMDCYQYGTVKVSEPELDEKDAEIAAIMTDEELVAAGKSLHVWPQIVADYHADVLSPRQIGGLYAVGEVAHNLSTRIEALITERAGFAASISILNEQSANLLTELEVSRAERDTRDIAMVRAGIEAAANAAKWYHLWQGSHDCADSRTKEWIASAIRALNAETIAKETHDG